MTIFYRLYLLINCQQYFVSSYKYKLNLQSKFFREILYEDESFEERELSALVASKVYYHLGAYDEALHYALGAASLLDVNQSSEYVDTVVGKHTFHDN